VSRSGKPAKIISPITPQEKIQKKSLAVLFALLWLCVLAAGCKRERPGRWSSAQLHQVTQQLARAASDAAPRGTTIRILRARRGSNGPDALRVSVRGDAEAANHVRQALDDVATQNRLTVDASAQPGTVSILTLRSGTILTHRVEIETVSAPEAARAEHGSAGAARLAIVLDDLGNDRKAADAVFALHVPITLSVLPYHEHSREIAAEAKRRGCEVLLHLPMQSVANETPEQQELKPGLSQPDVEEMVNKMLEAVPEADGVNNHQGSQATANAALMNELMPVLRDAGVFYVDSRTTAATLAFETAKQDGVRTAFRNVPFLDDLRDSAAIKRQLQIAIRGAKEKGEAIAIGHPHPETLQALREMLPEAKKQGVRLVPVSDVVH
jgi:polysaccharide deacetylase 2 family uncharacterized protein YibQ